MNWLLYAARNTLRNRRRTLITVLIACIGTAAIMTSGGFAIYTYDGLRELAARDSGHLILAHADYFDHDEEAPMALGLTDYPSVAKALLPEPEVRNILPRVKFSGLVSNGDKSTIFIGSGIDPEEFAVKGPTFTVTSGQRLTGAEQELPQVMLGQTLARAMHAQVGSGLTLLGTTAEGALNAIDVEVVGIFTTGVPELDERLLLTHIATAQTLLVSDKVSTLSIYLSDTDDTDALAARVRARYPELGLQTWLDQAFFYKKVRDLYNRIFGTLGLVIMVMVFFSVSNTMSMVVVERTREIGTLAAMGTRAGEIIRNFVLEALVIGGLGTALGLLLSALITLLLALADIQMPPPPGRSDGYPLAIYFSWELAALTLPLVIGVCMVAAFIAARRGTRKPIVEALAHV